MSDDLQQFYHFREYSRASYPLFYLVRKNTDSDGVYIACHKCANKNREKVFLFDINMDNSTLSCDLCGTAIECAFPPSKEEINLCFTDIE